MYTYYLMTYKKRIYNMKIGAGPAKRSEVRRVYTLAQVHTWTRTIWCALTVDFQVGA